jgi:hypothetical protein
VAKCFWVLVKSSFIDHVTVEESATKPASDWGTEVQGPFERDDANKRADEIRQVNRAVARPFFGPKF